MSGQHNESSLAASSALSIRNNSITAQLFEHDRREFNNVPLYNHEAIALYLKHQFKIHHPQTFALAGSEDLRTVLPHLKLTEKGDKAFILVRPYIHSMALFFYRSEEITYCYFFDSQNWGDRYYPNRLIKQAINTFIPKAQLCVLNEAIQPKTLDQGCTYYSLAFLEYCAKHSKPEMILASEFASTVSSSSAWVVEQHRLKHLVLDNILNAFYHSAGGLDEQKVQKTVAEMQGLDLIDVLGLDAQPMYKKLNLVRLQHSILG